jgi:hypothetical protein
MFVIVQQLLEKLTDIPVCCAASQIKRLRPANTREDVGAPISYGVYGISMCNLFRLAASSKCPWEVTLRNAGLLWFTSSG